MTTKTALTVEERNERRDERYRRQREQRLADNRAALPEHRKNIQRLLLRCGDVLAALDRLDGDWAAADEDLTAEAAELSDAGWLFNFRHPSDYASA